MIWALAGLGDEPRSLVDAGRRTADFYTPTTSSEVPPGCLRKPDGTIVCLTSTLPPSGCVQGPSGMVCKDTPAPPKTDTNAVEPPKEAGTPWFLWAIVGLGVAGMVASAYGDKGFEPNARRRGRRRRKAKRGAGYKGKYRAGIKGSTRVKLHLHHADRGNAEASLKMALADLRRHKLKPGRIKREKMKNGEKTWGLTVSTTVAKADKFQVEMNRSRVGSYESYID